MREKPDLYVAVLVPEIPLRTSFARQKINFLLPASFQAVEGVECSFRRRWGAVLFLSERPGWRGSCRESPMNRAVMRFGGEVVAVADDAREGDLTGDAVLQRPHPRRASVRAAASDVEPEQGMNENGTP